MNTETPNKELSYNIQIDYTNVGDDKILPFVIELDLENSILAPEADEKQRFCYQITGVGQDIPLFSDLKYFVLGINDEIPKEDIINIQVTIDDQEQQVQFKEDGNVQYHTVDSLDSEFAIPGIQFNFGLNKYGSIMTISYELSKPYELGSNSLCLFGDGFMATGLSICGPVIGHTDICPSIIYQTSHICVPVKVIPFTKTGKIKVNRDGDPVIITNSKKCCGDPTCNSHFTVTQNICIAVPIRFGAKAKTGEYSVTCSNPYVGNDSDDRIPSDADSSDSKSLGSNIENFPVTDRLSGSLDTTVEEELFDAQYSQPQYDQLANESEQEKDKTDEKEMDTANHGEKSEGFDEERFAEPIETAFKEGSHEPIENAGKELLQESPQFNEWESSQSSGENTDKGFYQASYEAFDKGFNQAANEATDNELSREPSDSTEKELSQDSETAPSSQEETSDTEPATYQEENSNSQVSESNEATPNTLSKPQSSSPFQDRGDASNVRGLFNPHFRRKF